MIPAAALTVPTTIDPMSPGLKPDEPDGRSESDELGPGPGATVAGEVGIEEVGAGETGAVVLDSALVIEVSVSTKLPSSLLVTVARVV